MARATRLLGTTLVIAGVATLAWTLVVWQWKDPVTAAYTGFQQHRAAESYDAATKRFAASVASEEAGSGAGKEPSSPAADGEAGARPRGAQLTGLARRFRDSLSAGDTWARLVVPRLGLDAYVLDGTDSATLRRGPGRYRGSFLPGEGELIYIAGHRTTYGAPFARIDALRRGDLVQLDVPYGRFEYRVTGHRIVAADAVWVLETRHREVVVLQACHPRFFASHRYLVYASLVRADARATGGTT